MFSHMGWAWKGKKEENLRDHRPAIQGDGLTTGEILDLGVDSGCFLKRILTITVSDTMTVAMSIAAITMTAITMTAISKTVPVSIAAAITMSVTTMSIAMPAISMSTIVSGCMVATIVTAIIVSSRSLQILLLFPSFLLLNSQGESQEAQKDYESLDTKKSRKTPVLVYILVQIQIPLNFLVFLQKIWSFWGVFFVPLELTELFYFWVWMDANWCRMVGKASILYSFPRYTIMTAEGTSIS